MVGLAQADAREVVMQYLRVEIEHLREEVKELSAKLAVARAVLATVDIPDEEEALEKAKKACLEDDEHDWIAHYIKEVESLFY